MSIPARLFNARPAADAFPCGGRLTVLPIATLTLFACISPGVFAESVSIDGGASWTGWNLEGISNRGYLEGPQSPVPGIYGRNGTASVYEVYTTSFLFDAAVNVKSGIVSGSQTLSGSTGFASTGTGVFKAFADGNQILGVGVKYVSGGALSGDRTLRIDTFGNSYLAATTVAANDGRASFSRWSHQGDYTVQFRTTDFNIASVNSQGGDPFNGGVGFGTDSTRTLASQFSINSTNSNLPFRVFANTSSGSATSYQVFVDLDATYQLFGTPNGIGATIGSAPDWYPVNDAGPNVTYAINGWGTVDTAFGAAVVPEPSLPAIAAVSLMALGAGRLIARRMRGSLRQAGRGPAGKAGPETSIY